jgi:CRP-like cAMP-binding protein
MTSAAIEKLESELLELESGDLIAQRSRDLVRLLAAADKGQFLSKIEKYGFLAFRSFLAEKNALSAMAFLIELKGFGISQELFETMSKRWALAVGHQRKKISISSGDSLSGDFREFQARAVVEEFGDDFEINRPQIEEIKIAGLPLFNQWPVETINDLMSIATRVSIESGQALFHEGDSLDSIYLLISGQIEMESKKGGRRVVRAGEFLGDICLVIDEPHLASAEALEPAELVSFPAKSFLQVLRSRRQLLEHFRDWAYRKVFFLSAASSLTFESLNPSDWVQLGGLFSVIEVKPRACLKNSDQKTSFFALILKGCVEVSNPSSQPIFLGAGHFLGEAEFVFKHDSLNTWEASTHCHLMIFDTESFMLLKERFPDVLHRIESSVGKKNFHTKTEPIFLMD